MDFNSEFLKDRYDYELDRKDKLTAALALPVGGTSVARLHQKFRRNAAGRLRGGDHFVGASEAYNCSSRR